MFESYPDVLTVSQLSTALQIGINNAYSLVNNGTINSIRLGRKILIPKVFLLSFIESYDIMLSGTTGNLTVFSERGVNYDR